MKLTFFKFSSLSWPLLFADFLEFLMRFLFHLMTGKLLKLNVKCYLQRNKHRRSNISSLLILDPLVCECYYWYQYIKHKSDMVGWSSLFFKFNFFSKLKAFTYCWYFRIFNAFSFPSGNRKTVQRNKLRRSTVSSMIMLSDFCIWR